MKKKDESKKKLLAEKFAGEDGNRKLTESLLGCPLVNGDGELAAKMLECAELVTYDTDDIVIGQGGADDDLYVIMLGRVKVVVNSREIAIRVPSQHVGEMAMVDSTAARCASVFAMEPTAALKLSEGDFTRLAEESPKLWRSIAKELSARLRQRNELVRMRNPRPVLFLGTSVEMLPIADAIQTGLSHEDIVVQKWTESVFGASQYPLESLDEQLKRTDFAALVLGSEDVVTSRRRQKVAPRDNVILELGLFLGALGRERCYIVKERGIDLKIPSDLAGITTIDYAGGGDKDTLASRLGPVCTQLKHLVKTIGQI